MECIQLHLQTVFRCDVAEAQRFYISIGLKKPNRVPIWDFVQRIEASKWVLGSLALPVLLFKGCKVYKGIRTL